MPAAKNASSDLQTVARPEERALTAREASEAIRHELEQRHDELAKALAGRYDPGFFLQVALTQFTRTPALWSASRSSVIRAVIEAGQLGLPFLAGRAWLVPYKNHGATEAQLIVGYQGLVDLVTGPETGVTFVESAVVYAADEFAYERGTNAYLRHREAAPEVELGTTQDQVVAQRGPRVAAWARVVYRTGQSRFDVMSWAEIEAIRQRSRAGREGPWVTDYDEMAKKTVLRRLCKTQRISLTAMAVLESEDEFERAAREERSAGAGEQQRLRRQLARSLGAEVPEEEQPAAGEAQPELHTDGGEAVDNLPPEPPASVHKPLDPAVCGATVTDPEGARLECTLAAGHTGQHTDGQHDWGAPRRS
jgi:recombination protein RecT